MLSGQDKERFQKIREKLYTPVVGNSACCGRRSDRTSAGKGSRRKSSAKGH